MRGKLLGRLARWGWRDGRRSDKRRIRSIEINLWQEDVEDDLHPDVDREWGDAWERRQQRMRDEEIFSDPDARGWLREQDART